MLTRFLLITLALCSTWPVELALTATAWPSDPPPGWAQLPALIALGVATALGSLTIGAALGLAAKSAHTAPLRFPAQGTVTGGIAALVLGLVICVTWTPGDVIVVALLAAMALGCGVLLLLPVRGADVVVLRFAPLVGTGLAQAAIGAALYLSGLHSWAGVGVTGLVIACCGLHPCLTAGRRSGRRWREVLSGRAPDVAGVPATAPGEKAV
jgi:hypothetical protein